jgi:hypothetical protein
MWVHVLAEPVTLCSSAVARPHCTAVPRHGRCCSLQHTGCDCTWQCLSGRPTASDFFLWLHSPLRAVGEQVIELQSAFLVDLTNCVAHFRCTIHSVSLARVFSSSNLSRSVVVNALPGMTAQTQQQQQQQPEVMISSQGPAALYCLKAKSSTVAGITMCQRLTSIQFACCHGHQSMQCKVMC